MPSKSSGGTPYTDDFAWRLAEHLLEDFKPFLPSPFGEAAMEACASRNIESWRGLACGQEGLTIYQYKTSQQILDLFKKFSFSADLYTPNQLNYISRKKFIDNQVRLSSFVYEGGSLEKAILFGAKGYVDKILGDFSHLEICERATFGKKSSVGIPMRKACEGERYEAPITGSSAHIEWFSKYYGVWNRPALEYAKSRQVPERPAYRAVDRLEAVLVPKTWKSLRMIMPNTTLGTLYSSGLGNTIEDRLRRFGYDIRHLQQVHGVLAKWGSSTGSLVTADQSMASDNITTWLIDTICPRRWASALQFGRIEEISLYGDIVKTPTFSTMGIGFTFPLQTLVFLALLLSVRDYCKLDEQAVVSVFGDDLIYDRRIHDVVMEVFPALGLVINPDKTFSEGEFRESCGYDYYRGVDVRPFHLGEAAKAGASRRRTEAYLYTSFNGLRRRWEMYECPAAFGFISEEIRKIRGGEPLLVPTDYPDTSGCKLDRDEAWANGFESKIRRNENGLFSFSYLAFEPKKRKEDRHFPYYARRLQNPATLALESHPHDLLHGDILDERSPMFSWETVKGRSIRSEITGKRLRPQQAFIPEQDAGRFRERPGVSGNWTPEGIVRATKPKHAR